MQVLSAQLSAVKSVNRGLFKPRKLTLLEHKIMNFPTALWLQRRITVVIQAIQAIRGVTPLTLGHAGRLALLTRALRPTHVKTIHVVMVVNVHQVVPDSSALVRLAFLVTHVIQLFRIHVTSNHVLTVAHAAEMATLSFRARALMVIQEPHARQLLGRAVQVLVKMAVPVQMLAAQTSLVIARMTTMTATPVLNIKIRAPQSLALMEDHVFVSHT